ncbi:DNA polymerase III subunit delta [Legionella septentrionalis]|uniref:DNA polymerase III subunit delta n=1 Tax=Legionella septentrionalis TaxID=2498109 RepID=UPI000F8D4FE8|nr:DNA polymerase III subunit delta [Legionella septentrionalis]RUR14670.1 DNA polymerase III subunit delta [Legionella septentrionalis]
MLLKYQDLTSSLHRKICPVYILIGQDHYLLNDAAYQIKKSWHLLGDSDDKILYMNLAQDWAALIEEANNYSLFAEHVLLDVRYEKKSLENAGKEKLNQYLADVNPRCLIILRAPHLSSKQLQGFSANEQVLIVQASPFTPTMLQKWIIAQLNRFAISYEPEVPALIHRYTQGNMLACAQVLEIIRLVIDEKEILTQQMVIEQLIDQCNYQLYELSDACLSANTEKAIHILRQASENRTEPALILWLLAQEVRQLIQLSHLLSQAVAFSTACSQLKIWPQRVNLYQSALRRLPLLRLYQLLSLSQTLDEQIKTSHNQQVWLSFEQMVINLTT